MIEMPSGRFTRAGLAKAWNIGAMAKTVEAQTKTANNDIDLDSKAWYCTSCTVRSRHITVCRQYSSKCLLLPE